MVAFDEFKQEFDEVGASILAASVDTLENATVVQEELDFHIAYGIIRDQAASIGSWWEDRHSFIQPSEFILGRDGSVISATYSTGPVGRLMPEDALKLIRYREAQKGGQ